MGTGVSHTAEVVLRLYLVLFEHEVTRHQAARGGRDRPERERLALEVGQALHIGVGGDELGRELRVLLTLHQRRGIGVFEVHLDKGEAAQPSQVEAVRGQRLDHRRVVGHRHELHLHAQRTGQVLPQRLELALQFSGCFVGDGTDPQRFCGLGDNGTAGQHEAGDERQRGFEHGHSPGQWRGKGRLPRRPCKV
ncbi:hypothetical protein D3C80_1452750 [compost metagenome]